MPLGVIKNSIRKGRFPVASCEDLYQGKLWGFSEGFPHTAISIWVKIAAHLTELSVAPMVHHGLLFQYVSEAVWRNGWHLTDSDGVDEAGWAEKEMYGTFPWSLHINKLGESDEEVLIKSKSWDLKEDDMLWSADLCSIIITEQTEIAAVMFQTHAHTNF